MSLTRETLDKWLNYAREDLTSAPADGMLVYLIDNVVPENSGQVFTRKDIEMVAVAYYKAMQDYLK